ncbi:acireductone dioxygenase [Pseudomonas sp. LS44]|uniref:1,2-dihydroxy-3-keto-5-methylthiopentene dioxygenase n=1 Tax=Pseudomonas sp. LS44 TaxID=1357074 RepID=UPI00215B1520|nr:acireductone dioxygenase [Pseudomonas sp. LS44]UVE16239.1 acireductone dioxygenase [Pseudomonas sp. LS44]
MSCLTVYAETSPEQPNKLLTHGEDITATLAEIGVRFERWQTQTPLSRDSSHAELLAAYQPHIDQLRDECGYRASEVLSVTREHRQKDELCAKLLDEHRREQDEVCFFVSGRGLYSVHVNGYVFSLLCEKGDLLVIPAGIRHWFDLGEQPHCIAIRLSGGDDGAVELTGEDIASRFPRLDDQI